MSVRTNSHNRNYLRIVVKKFLECVTVWTNPVVIILFIPTVMWTYISVKRNEKHYLDIAISI